MREDGGTEAALPMKNIVRSHKHQIQVKHIDLVRNQQPRLGPVPFNLATLVFLTKAVRI